jgi:hypothetical protein
MKRKTLALTFALVLLFSSAAGLMPVDVVVANPGYMFPREHYPAITINVDGTISPQTNLISQNKTIYTLNADVTDHLIIILCNDIIFDGNGHTVNNGVNDYTVPDYAIQVFNEHQVVIKNVTIKDIEVSAAHAISLVDCSSCQLTNVKTNSIIELVASDRNNISQCVCPIRLGSGAKSNQVFHNNISQLSIGHEGVASNVFYENNFLGDGQDVDSDCFWNKGSMGNYWAGYNGTDADGDGIGDTPYIIDENNIDHYPLMYPFDIENNKIALPASAPQQTIPLPVALAAGISALAVAVAVTAFISHHKKAVRSEKVESIQKVISLIFLLFALI